MYSISKREYKVSIPGPGSRYNLNRLNTLIGRSNYTGLFGVTISGGYDNYLVDVDGNEYLDCFSAASTNILGYSAGIEEVYYKQAKKIQHTAFGYSPNVPALDLAEKLIEIAPGNTPKKVLFGLSGSDACGTAIAATRKYTEKLGIISFKYAYHGATGLSQPASGFDRHSDGLYDPDLPNFAQLDYPTTDRLAEWALDQIARLLGEDYGGVLIEPIQGDAGVLFPAPGFLKELRDLLDKYDAVLSVDEIQTGMGRTGKWWAIEYEGIEPDIILSAKGLAAGYAPISAAIGRSGVIDSLDPGQRIFSFIGHPPSAVAAIEAISIVEREGLRDRAAQLGRNLISGFRNTAKKYNDIIREVRGRGLIIGLEIDNRNDAEAGMIFARRVLEKGLYLGFFGDENNIVRIQPPLTLRDDEVERLVETVAEVAGEMSRGEIPDYTLTNVDKFSEGM